MDNFVFQNHTRIYFGKGVVREYLAKLLVPYGKNVLLAYGGGSIKKTGIYDAVGSAAHAAGKILTDFCGIMANPTKADEAELAKIAATVQTGPGSYHKCSPEDVAKIFKSCW